MIYKLENRPTGAQHNWTLASFSPKTQSSRGGGEKETIISPELRIYLSPQQGNFRIH